MSSSKIAENAQNKTASGEPVVSEPARQLIEAFLTESEKAKAKLSSMASVKAILSQPMQLQAEALMAAVSIFSDCQKTLLTSHLPLSDRVQLHFDVMFGQESSVLDSVLGRRVLDDRFISQLIWSETQEELLQALSIRKLLSHEKAHPIYDAIAEHVAQFCSNYIPSNRRGEAHLPGLILLLGKRVLLDDDQFTFLIDCAIERSLADSACSSEISGIEEPLRFPYAGVFSWIEHYASTGQLTKRAMIALDRYCQCLKTGPHYNSTEASPEGKKYIEKINAILTANGFRFPEESRSFNLYSYKPAVQEELGVAFAKTLGLLADQGIAYRSIYFALAFNDVEQLNIALAEFPELSGFQSIHQPAIGQPLHLLSNIPPSELFTWLAPSALINIDSIGQQFEVEKLKNLLVGAGSRFSVFWSFLMLWGLSPKKSESEEPCGTDPLCGLALQADPSPKDGTPRCRLITTWLDDFEIANLGALHSQDVHTARLKRTYA